MSGPLLEWNRLLRALLLVESALRVCVPPAITMGRDEREGPSELLNMAVVATATHAAKTMVINVTLHAAGSGQRGCCCEPKSEVELVPEGRFFAHIVCGAAVQLCSCTAPKFRKSSYSHQEFHTQIPSPHVSGDCELPRDRLPARLCPPPDRVGSLAVLRRHPDGSRTAHSELPAN